MLAIIGGTNMSAMFPPVEHRVYPRTPFGATSAPIESHRHEETKFLYLPRHGRTHGTKAHKVNYRANVWALRDLGVTTVIAGATVGSIDPDLTSGDLVIPDQIIDYSYDREVSFGVENIQEHFDFSEPFTPAIRDVLKAAARDADVPAVDRGTYGCTQGPRFETNAEIRRMSQDGCTLVGMTLMPEAALVRQLDIAYGGICLVVNPAAGVAAEKLAEEDLRQVAQQAAPRLHSVLLKAIERF